jgi:hypothetical protein
LSISYQVRVSSYSHVLSRQVMNVITPRGPDAGRSYLVAEAPGGMTRFSGPSWVGVGEGMGRQVVKSYLAQSNMTR